MPVIAAPLLAAVLSGAIQDNLPHALRPIVAALDSGRVEAALAAAERYVRSHRRDPDGYLVLGDVHAARLPAGRFLALDAYQTAKQLAPGRHEPLERLVRVALQIGGADGERLARQNLEALLERDGAHPTAWDQWLVLFRSGGGRRRMIDRLGRSTGPTAGRRRALLLIEDEVYPAAAALLDSLLSVVPGDPSLLALRAQAALESGDTVVGMAYYGRALTAADRDSTETLWRQVIGIATPAEVRAWTAGVPPDERRRWFELFWARRNPNLFAGLNTRVAEHFVRLRHARRQYPLLHPLVAFHRSALARTLTAEPSPGEREFHLRCEIYQDLAPSVGGAVPVPGASSARDRAPVSMGALAHLTEEELASAELFARLWAAGAHNRLSLTLEQAVLERTDPFLFAPTLFAPLGFGLHDVDSTAARVGYNLATGLDDRGVMYLRFGAPGGVTFGGDNRVDPGCNSSELERWRYPELGEVRFARPNVFARGLMVGPEMVFRPMSERQSDVMRLGLSSDAPSEPATLSFGVWTAQFHDPDDPAVSRLLVVSTVGEVAASLVGGDPAASADTTGLMVLTAPAGRYALLAHARSGGELGRQQQSLTVRSFVEAPALSDLLLLRAWPDPPRQHREALPAIVRTLTFASSDTVRAYAELYGMPVEGGRVQYRAAYSLLRTNDPFRDRLRRDWSGAVRFDFVRDVPQTASGVLAEVLDIQPERLSPGRYLLRLDVIALDSSPIGRATVSFVVR